MTAPVAHFTQREPARTVAGLDVRFHGNGATVEIYGWVVRGSAATFHISWEAAEVSGHDYLADLAGWGPDSSWGELRPLGSFELSLASHTQSLPYDVVDAGGGVNEDGAVDFHGQGRLVIPTRGDDLDVSVVWPAHRLMGAERLPLDLLR